MTTATYAAKNWLVGLGNPSELRELRLFKRDSQDIVAGFFDDINAMIEVVNKYSGEWFVYVTLNQVCLRSDVKNGHQA